MLVNLAFVVESSNHPFEGLGPCGQKHTPDSVNMCNIKTNNLAYPMAVAIHPLVNKGPW